MPYQKPFLVFKQFSQQVNLFVEFKFFIGLLHQKLQDILIRRAGYESKARELVSGSINVLEIRECRKAIDVLKSKQRSQMMNVHAAERDVELARKQLNEAMVERKTHEKLKEKAFEEFKQELLHEESKEIDELVSYTYHDNGQRS